MKKIILLFLLLPLSFFAQDEHDHSGHSHGEAVTDASASSRRMCEASSTSYEAVISYGDIHPGEAATLNLFISDVETNAALDSIEVTLTSADQQGQNIPLTKKQKGWYEFQTNFPQEGHYNFFVGVNGRLGNATLKLSGLEVGTHTHGKEAEAHVHAWYTNPWIAFAAGIIVMIIVMILARVMKNKKAIALFVFGVLFTSEQFFHSNTLYAHEGHDHSPKKTTPLTDHFSIPKETQFLFDVLTTRVNLNSFTPARKLFGTILPAPGGLAELHTPQVARVNTISVQIGQQVSKGQTLAVLELISEGSVQIGFQEQLNNARAEYEAAKKEVDRLKAISDIVSQKQIDEAKARLDKATENKKLLESGGNKSYVLSAPISGIVEPFSMGPGSTVDPADVLFAITNSQNILVEAQVYEEDLATIRNAKKFALESSDGFHAMEDVKLLSIGQRLQRDNQSQKVVFDLSNQENSLRIGETVSVFAYENSESNHLYVPNESLTEINGQPAVFVKESAEVFRIVYISTGRDNGIYTEVLDGLDANQRVVTKSTYQVKMIFLNQ